jgi:hypothetical protein
LGALCALKSALDGLGRRRWRFAINALAMIAGERPSEVLRKPEPGALWPWVKIVSYVELVLFAGLMFVWLAPGFDRETFYFGLSHGIGFIVLALLIWVAVLRHEAPYTLLAATLTPAGPVGAVIGIAWLEHREPNYRDDAHRGQPNAAKTKPG